MALAVVVLVVLLVSYMKEENESCRTNNQNTIPIDQIQEVCKGQMGKIAIQDIHKICDETLGSCLCGVRLE